MGDRLGIPGVVGISLFFFFLSYFLLFISVFFQCHQLFHCIYLNGFKILHNYVFLEQAIFKTLQYHPSCRPLILFNRNNNTKDLECFASEAISINRMMQQHLFISDPSSFFIGNREGNLLEDSDENDDYLEGLTVPSIKLSPPCSTLAKRRTAINISVGGDDELDSLPSSSHSSDCGINISV